MATNYPNIEGGYVPIEDKVYSPSETRIWRQLRFGKADIPFYTVTAISGEPSSDSENILVIFTETSSIQWLGRRTNGYITIPAGKYFNTAQYDYSTAPKETTYYAVSECQLYWESEQFPLANDFYWDFYLTSGTLTQLHLIENASPNAPSTITVPDTVRGGADIDISWSAVTDPDGNLDGYIVERSYNGGSSWAQIYQGRTTSTTTTIPFGTQTVTFRVCAYDTYGEKSSWRTSANKTVVNNRAPTAPPSISVPLSPSGGDKLTITWTASTDADGNLEGYELERQWDGTGAFTQIYKGAALSFQDDIPKAEHTSVVYRVRAYDSFASYSSYTASPSRTIDNNTAPVIACDLSGDLGEKSEGFSVPYTVSDAEQQEVTVVEKVGDLVKRTYTVTLNQQNTFEVTGEYFQKILNGAQAVQIVATDSAGKTSTLELTFTKAVHKAVITLSEPLAVEEQITVAVLAITGKIPADATQLIELTNNGNDPEPVWEDATADVKAGRNHPFTNKTQTNGWAFNFRVTVERGESGEDGNIVSIQGGFQ